MQNITTCGEMSVSWGKVNLRHPDPTVFQRTAAIGQALSRINRWNGHTWTSWSVAAHSVVAAWLVPIRWRLVALTHDAHEAICGDVPKPMREMLPEFLSIEEGWKTAAATHWEIERDAVAESVINVIDRHLAATEARDLLRMSNADAETVGGAAPLPVSLQAPGILSFNVRPERWVDAWCALASGQEWRMHEWTTALDVLGQNAGFMVDASRRVVDESIRSALGALS